MPHKTGGLLGSPLCAFDEKGFVPLCTCILKRTQDRVGIFINFSYHSSACHLTGAYKLFCEGGDASIFPKGEDSTIVISAKRKNSTDQGGPSKHLCVEDQRLAQQIDSKSFQNETNFFEKISDGPNQQIEGNSSDIHRTGAKCVPDGLQDSYDAGPGYHSVGVLRTKPGRGDPTLSMSCSDKIMKWSVVGEEMVDQYVSGFH